MTRLSSPESALRKIESVQDRIDILYGAVDRIQELRDRLAETADAAAAHETALEERLESLGRLEAEYRAAAERLAARSEETAREMERVRVELEWERDGVRNTLRSFGEERDRQRAYRGALETELRAVARETAAGAAYLEARTAESVRETALASARERDEVRSALAAGLDDLRDEAALIREEAFHLEDRLEAFKADLSDRFDRRVDLLAERQRIFRETAVQELNRRFDETAETLEGRTDAAEAALREAGAAERDRVSEAVAFLEAERGAADERRIAGEAERERLRDEVDALVEASRSRADQAIDDLNAVIAREVDHVAAFVADAESQIQGLKGELKGFRDKVAAAVHRRSETLRNEQVAFREALRQELDGRVSERLRAVERAQEQGMAALAAERKSVDETHQTLEEAAAQVSRRIKERTTFFSSRLNNLIVEAQRELSASAETGRNRVEEEIRRMGAFGDRQRAGLGKLREQLRGFAETIKTRVEADRERRTALWETFREEIEARVDARVGREAGRRADALREDLDARLAADAEARRADGETAAARAAAVENRMTALEGSQAEAESALRQRMSKVKKGVQRLLDRQDAADRTIPALEARIAALEETLRSRKGLFPFAGRKREESE